MKILQLISTTGFYGAEKVVINLAKGLQASGHNIVIGTLLDEKRSDRILTKEAQESGIKIIEIPCEGKYDKRTIPFINKYIQQEQFDIVHSHGYKANFYAGVSRLPAACKRVATCHNWLGQSPKMLFYRWLDKKVLKKFDAIIAVSEIIRREIEKAGISLGKVNKIYNGIIIEDYSQKQGAADHIRKEFNLSATDKVIGCIGRLSPEKGQRSLIKALVGSKNEPSKIKALIIGDGPLLGQLSNLAHKLNVYGQVVFTGVRQDIPDILAAIDIFVLPSLTEGLPMALLEAMAAKKPVIATAVGEVPQVIDHEVSGFLIQPNDHEGLKKMIRYILNNKEKAQQVAEKGFGELQARFSMQQMVESYSNLYLKLKA
ncbi:MAG: glycosyltransferase family 4 protein [bacterium]|nr:glycosyltransferase family 4 protein [bacterium]MDD5757124.1 glycosyltransferase family 4 protein [bacterium]